MTSASRRLRRNRQGTTSLEFAATGLTIMILLLAVLDVGRLFLAKRGLDYGIDRAARWASVNSATASAGTVLAQFQTAAGAAVQNAATCQGYAAGASVPPSTMCWITVGFSPGTAVGNFVTIQANYRWSPVTLVDGLVIATLKSNVTLAIQH